MEIHLQLTYHQLKVVHSTEQQVLIYQQGQALLTFENISDTNTQGLAASDYTTALNILKNKDEYRFATLTLPGVYQEMEEHQVAQ